jgi:hypothetical protein
MTTKFRWAGLACAGIVLLAGARLAFSGPSLLGSPGAEVYGHAWVQHWVAADWPGLSGQTDVLGAGAPLPWPVIDPAVTWCAAGLSRVVGAIGAWNAVVLFAVAGAFLGGWAVADAAGGDRLTGGVVLALGPVFAGSLASGLTEDFALGVLGITLAVIGRRESARADIAMGLGAGVLLGALAWMGLYLFLLGGLGAGVLVAAGGRRRWRELAITAGIALLLSAPALWLQGERLQGGEQHRSGAPQIGFEPHWRVNPRRGADLLSFVAPGPDPVDDGALIRLHPVYLGIGVVALAVAAGRRGGRWWALVALGLALAPGPELAVAGHPTGVANPFVAGLSVLPVFGLVNHWARFMLVAQVGWAALAAMGVERLRERGWRMAFLAPLGLVLEIVALSPAPWPLPVADADVPAIYRSLEGLPEGGVLVVPSAGPGVPFQRVLYRQRDHGRTAFAHPNRPGYGSVDDVPLVRWFRALPEHAEPPSADLVRSWRVLRDRGVGVLLVEDPYVGAVQELLGPPDRVAPGGAAWGVRP